MKTKTSTITDVLSGWFGEEKAVETIAKAGFDAFDYSAYSAVEFDWANNRSHLVEGHPLLKPDYALHARKLKRVAEDNGIECNQAHAPFPLFDKRAESLVKRSIETTAELGGKIIIVHPDKSKELQENVDYYLSILPFAKSHGVKIAAENMFEWSDSLKHALPKACGTKESFVAHMNAIKDDFFVACLDIGHAELLKDGTNAVDMVRALGDRLQALHIHDNDKTADNHEIPFSMSIDYKPIAAALKEIGYGGYFTLETRSYTIRRGRENALQSQIELKRALDRFVELFEKA